MRGSRRRCSSRARGWPVRVANVLAHTLVSGPAVGLRYANPTYKTTKEGTAPALPP